MGLLESYSCPTDTKSLMPKQRFAGLLREECAFVKEFNIEINNYMLIWNQITEGSTSF